MADPKNWLETIMADGEKRANATIVGVVLLIVFLLALFWVGWLYQFVGLLAWAGLLATGIYWLIRSRKQRLPPKAERQAASPQVAIKKDNRIDNAPPPMTLSFCPSCGASWSPGSTSCPSCTWDSRTDQFSDPEKALLAKRGTSAPADKSEPVRKRHLQGGPVGKQRLNRSRGGLLRKRHLHGAPVGQVPSDGQAKSEARIQAGYLMGFLGGVLAMNFLFGPLMGAMMGVKGMVPLHQAILTSREMNQKLDEGTKEAGDCACCACMSAPLQIMGGAMIGYSVGLLIVGGMVGAAIGGATAASRETR